MNTWIYPSRNTGSLLLPPSKSEGHRLLIAAALAKGESMVINPGFSKDIEATASALRHLGASIKREGNDLSVVSKGLFDSDGEEVFCGESGSTLRFLIPVFALLDKVTVFTGAGKLMERPQTVYESLFHELGLSFEMRDSKLYVEGPLRAGRFELRGDISSQFFTGLLFALPLLKEDSEIVILEPFESKSYVLMTIDVLKKAGISVTLKDNRLIIPGSQSYHPLHEETKADHSGSAFMAMLGAINGPIELYGLDPDSLQPDRAFFSHLKMAGANVRCSDHYEVSSGVPCYVEVDLQDCPDLGPALMTLGCYLGKGMKLINTRRLRYKESDRVGCMISELEKFGYHILFDENSITVLDLKDRIDTEYYDIDGHNDHRIVMALAVIATVMDKKTLIRGSEAVTKSYPGFFDDLIRLGIRVENDE